MARIDYKEALKTESLIIKDNYLVVDTIQQGYFNIFKGVHPFKVVETAVADVDAGTEADYAVYPVKWDEATGEMVEDGYPIIRTVAGDVFFVKHTLNDPYNGPVLDEVQSSSEKVEHKVLDAFNVFAESEFNLGQPNPIHVFIGDETEIGVKGSKVK